MRVLVTGGAGFIGSAYVRGLLTQAFGPAPEAVTVLDALTYSGNLANLAPVAADERFTFIHGDIADRDLVARVLPGHDVLVHLAAESDVDRSIAAADVFVRTNVLGTQTLLDAARAYGLRRFVHVSTDEVYGSIDTGSWSEDAPLAPTSPYAASKAASDLLALAYHRTHGLDVVVTRCSNNYGPYQFPEKIIPLFVTNLLDGRPVPLYGDGTNVRDWLHVDDHCRGIHAALLRGRAGEVYHLGGGQPLTNVELTRRLVDACGATWATAVRWVPDRKGHDRRYCLDVAKATAELGYRPRVDFDAGLRATVDWYRDNRAWWEPLKAAAAG